MPEPATVTSAAVVETRRRHRARVAVTIAFIGNGMMLGSWAPRIPAVKDALELSDGALGVALLAPALGTVLAARFAGALGARFGSARATRWFALCYFGLSWVPGAAGNLALLWIALLAWGAAMGCFDVSMNAQGVTVETGYGRPLLSGLHAAWSIGSFTGALLGGASAALGLNVAVQQAVLGAVAALVVLSASRHFLADPAHLNSAPIPRRRWRLRRPQRRLVLLGIAAIFALMAEGAVTDWSGVLLREHLHAPAGQDGLGFAAFSIAMTAGRLSGDRVVHALGRTRCLLLLSIVGAVGLGAGLVVNNVPAVIVGFVLLGLGLSIMLPTLVSTAADTDGASAPAIATISALGCVGMLVGPSLIGGVAEITDVHIALCLLCPFVLIAGAFGIAGIRLTRRAPAPQVPARA